MVALSNALDDVDGLPASEVACERQPSGEMWSCLAGFTVDRFGAAEMAGYPTICMRRYTAPHRHEGYHAFKAPVSPNLSQLLADLMEAGVPAFRIEGRGRPLRPPSDGRTGSTPRLGACP